MQASYRAHKASGIPPQFLFYPKPEFLLLLLKYKQNQQEKWASSATEFKYPPTHVKNSRAKGGQDSDEVGPRCLRSPRPKTLAILITALREMLA